MNRIGKGVLSAAVCGGFNHFLYSYSYCEQSQSSSNSVSFLHSLFPYFSSSPTSSPSPSLPKSFSATYPANNPSEDRRITYEPNQSTQGPNPNWRIYGVFDGHGGWQVSDYVQTNIISILLSKLSSNITIEEALSLTFQELEENYTQQIRPAYQLGFGEVAKVGSCVNLAIIQKNILTVANAGDCRTVIGSSLGSSSNRTQSDNHVIADVNGTLYTSYHVGRDHNARTSLEKCVLSLSHPGEGEGTVRCKSHNPNACYVMGRLQLTRALGDLYLKREEFNQPSDPLRNRGRYISPYSSPPYVLSSPEIQSVTLDSNDKFLVMASDGVWDFMSPLEVVSFVATHSPAHPSPQSSQDAQSSQDVAQLLVEEVLRRAAEKTSSRFGSSMSVEELKQLPQGKPRRSLHDDTTVIVVYL